MDRFDWDAVAKRGKHYLSDSFLCKSKKRQIIELIKIWDIVDKDKIVLQTDLFEEAVGYDGITRWLSGRYKKLFGIDISIEVLKQVYTKETDACVRYILSDIRNPAFKDNSFDLIISNSTIDHFADIELALQELYRILKPGGILILTLNNRLQFAFSFLLWLKRVLRIKDYSYGYSFTLSDIKSRSINIGFYVTDTTYIYFFPPLITFLVAHSNGKLKEILKSIVRIYEKKTASNIYFKKFTGSNIAIRLVKIYENIIN